MTRSVTLNVNEGSLISKKRLPRRYRSSQRLRRIATAFGLAMTAMLSAVIFCILPLNAAQYYKVKRGDNLTKIAKKYKTSINQIKSLNNLKSDRILVGQKLLVNKEKFVKKHYRVKKGDCLSKIARRYGVSVTEIKTLNNLKSDKITVGQRLLLMLKSKPTKKRPIKLSPIIEKKSRYYTVKKGDTLVSLSKRFNVSPEEIKKANLLANGHLKPGQILIIPEPEDFLGKLFQEEPVDNTLNKVSAEVVNVAIQYLGIPYRWGGTNRNGLDCSGFIREVYRKIGIILPHKARYQYYEGKKVPLDEIIPSDIVFFAKYPSSSRVDHVGLYLGEDLFIHACRKEKKVVIDNLNNNSYFQKRLIGARRFIHF